MTDQTIYQQMCKIYGVATVQRLFPQLAAQFAAVVTEVREAA